MTAAAAEEYLRVLAGLVTVLGSCGGAIYLLVRYQRTFIGAQDTEIDSLRDRLDEVVNQLDKQRRDHASEIAEFNESRRECEAENERIRASVRELRGYHEAEIERLENALATVRRQLAEALEGRLPYTSDDNPGTRSADT